MAPLIPIGQFVPPVTGINKSFIPVANMFDTSGNFRQRSVSLAKRRRGPDGDALDTVFDVSREFPALKTPAPPAINIFGIKNLLVEVAKTGKNLKAVIEKGDPGSKAVTIAKSVLTLYNCVEGLIEKAIVPLCGGQVWGGLGSTGPATPAPPWPPVGGTRPPAQTDRGARAEGGDGEG